ncbi:MAG: B-1,4-endoglucanase, partial [Bacteroidales bacterium]|nr:B-1,4-endoglucanase [Bacteroidales bacterium]
YGYSAEDVATEFTEIKTQYPSKMVTLAECGTDSGMDFPGVDAFWNAGAKWSWFNPWYGDSMPSDSWWEEAMKSDSVITRDGIPTDLFE